MAAPGPRQAAAEALPVITFSDASSYFLNGLKIHAFHVAHAHTDGDVMIQFEGANVIHAGDILFNGLYPFIDLDSGGSVDGYIAALEQLLSLCDDNTRIIAGHGPLADKTAVKRCLAMLVDARSRVKQLVDDGTTVVVRRDAGEAGSTP